MAPLMRLTAQLMANVVEVSGGRPMRVLDVAAGHGVFGIKIVPNEDRVSPPSAAAFAMTMLVQTPRGDAYTDAELGAMFGRAGFSRTEFHPLPPSTQHLAISYR
ncbi:hypothetical protein [Sorangium sp. So ce426]|uniref:hypothetical protein n=1 Tax=Sorangium sp. So ce426 TaxID=3133312 RepID=UPI003F5B8196